MRKPETVFELSIDGPLDLRRNIGETECLIFYQDSTGQLVARSAVSLDTATFLWQKFLKKEQKEVLKDIRYATPMTQMMTVLQERDDVTTYHQSKSRHI